MGRIQRDSGLWVGATEGYGFIGVAIGGCRARRPRYRDCGGAVGLIEEDIGLMGGGRGHREIAGCGGPIRRAIGGCGARRRRYKHRYRGYGATGGCRRIRGYSSCANTQPWGETILCSSLQKGIIEKMREGTETHLPKRQTHPRPRWRYLQRERTERYKTSPALCASAALNDNKDETQS